MEKQLSRYHNDNYDNEANVAIEHLNSKERTHCKYTKWFRCISGKIILVFLIMGLFIVAQAFRLPAKWQKKWPHGYNTTSNLDITKATKGLQSLWNHDTPFFSLAPAPGISIAVSKDPDSNIQLYDLDSSGVLRIRRRSNSNDQTNTKWTSPQIIPTDPKPKQSSPLAAIAFQFRAGVTELRVYYLDTSNRIVEFGTSFSSSSDLSWSRTEHFSTGSTGGLAAVWLGSEGIRLYFVDKDDSVGQLVWYANSWRSPTSLKLPALAGSPVAAQSSYFGGDFYGIFLHYVNRDKELTEGQYIPQVDPDNFRPGRIIDPNFTGIGGGIISAIAIDDNPHFWRSFYLGGDYGLIQRTGGPPGITDYTQVWTRTALDSPYSDVLGGAVAAVTWKNNIRVFYVSTGSLVEVALFFTSNTEGSWSSLGKIA